MDKDKPENVPEKTHNHADFQLQGQTREIQGQSQGQNISLLEERYLGNVPESSEEQVQEQGRLSYAPCNPVTLSFTLNLGAYKKKGKNKNGTSKEKVFSEFGNR